MIGIVLLFLFFSIVGWMIDATWCSFSERKLVSHGSIEGVPVSPIYGFGGCLLYLVVCWFNVYPWWAIILIGAMLVTILEYVGAVFCEKVLGKKYWDYSNAKFNLHGRVDIFHFLAWVLMSFWYMKYFYIYNVRWLNLPVWSKMTVMVDFGVSGLILFFIAGEILRSRKDYLRKLWRRE